MEPLKFGKLLDQTNNKFIIQLNTKNIAVINHYEKENFVRIYQNGDLVLEFRDTFIADNSFSRLIRDTKFTFVNERLARTEILNVSGSFTIFNNSENITPLNYTDSNSIQFLKKHNNNPLLSILTYLDKVVIKKKQKVY
jgi:hypothetical protein